MSNSCIKKAHEALFLFNGEDVAYIKINNLSFVKFIF